MSSSWTAGDGLSYSWSPIRMRCSVLADREVMMWASKTSAASSTIMIGKSTLDRKSAFLALPVVVIATICYYFSRGAACIASNSFLSFHAYLYSSMYFPTS